MWTEIAAQIKGSAEAWDQQRPLSAEQYESLGRKRTPMQLASMNLRLPVVRFSLGVSRPALRRWRG